MSDKWDTGHPEFDWDFFTEETPVVEKSQYQLERMALREADRAALNLDRAKRRARAAVHDLAMASDMAYFVTLTLNREKVDRYDMKEITRKLNSWLDNQVRRHGLAYVLVPERHKDGAVHFHGFFNDALEVVDSGHKDAGGHTVYNLPAWSLGFTTAIPLYGEKRAAVAYCCKYVSKAQEKIGGRWYYSGGSLQRPRIEYADVPFADFAAQTGAQKFQLAELECAVLSIKIDAPEGS